MPTPTTTTDFIDLVRQSETVPPQQLAACLDDLGDQAGEPTQVARALVKRGLLTPFQAKLLLAGKFRGFKLGAYVIRDQIGEGGMGAVYLAEHAALRRRVALKVLTQAAAVGKAAVERFLREARAAAALDHPNIVRIHDVDRRADLRLHYLVMEYVEGQTLEALIRAGGTVPCGRAVEFITQAAAGLQHAHEKGFVHRDIKPANLILAKDGTVKILDMGLARSFTADGDKLTEAFDRGAILGTAEYIAPEQAMNNPGLDIRADIYSLGATFFALVAGRPPFQGTAAQLLVQHQMKEAPDLTTLDKTFPPGLAQVIAKMLAKKPEDRYQTPAEVIAALAPWAPALSSTGLTGIALGGDTLADHAGVDGSGGIPAAGGAGQPTTLIGSTAVRKTRALVLIGAGAAVIALSFGAVIWALFSDPTVRKGDDPNRVAPPSVLKPPSWAPQQPPQPNR